MLRFVRNLYLVLSPCRYSLLILLIGGVSFLFVPQGQDVLRRMVEWDAITLRAVARLVLFVVSTLAWALSTWYWARVILNLTQPNNAEQEGLRTWVPRVMGVSALVLMSGALLMASFNYVRYTTPEGRVAGGGPILRLRVLAVTLLVLAGVFLAFVRKRRDLRADRAGRPATQPAAYYAGGLPRETKQAIRGSLLASLVLGLLFAFAPVPVGQFLGTLPIVMLTAANWVLLGTGLLYGSRLARFPLLLLLLALAVLFSRFNDNHAVRLAQEGAVPRRPTIQEKFLSWQKGKDPRKPIFIVAAEGGGIRAAYWTAIALGKLEDDSHGFFANQVFAISGVSGGSLGGAVFAALVAEKAAGRNLNGCGGLHGCAADILQADFLSPTVARMVAPDLVQRFWLFPLPFTDRAKALEDSWAHSWQNVLGADARNRFDESFLKLWEGSGAATVPSLALNGTHVESGRRIVASNLTWKDDELRDTYDLLQVLGPERPADAAADLPLKTAIHASARFTYVSPAGTMKPAGGRNRGHVVDGGYFENSGTVTALELANVIRPLAGSTPIVMIYLRNSPTTDPKAKVDPGNPADTLDDASVPAVAVAAAPARGAAQGGPAPEPAKDLESFSKSYPRLNELLSPPRALLNTRGARGSLAVKTACVELEGNTSSCRPRQPRASGRPVGVPVTPQARRFLEIGLCEYLVEKGVPKRAPLPLGWQLSETSRQAMDNQLQGIKTSCRDLHNDQTLKLIGSFFRDGIPQTVLVPAVTAADGK